MGDLGALWHLAIGGIGLVFRVWILEEPAAEVVRREVLIDILRYLLIDFERRDKSSLALDRPLESVVPCIAYGETREGLARGRPENTVKKRKNFEKLIGPLPMLWLDQETLRRFHDLFWELCRKGTPIPPNDIWIAALYLQHDAVLITDDSDFAHVPGLQVRSW